MRENIKTMKKRLLDKPFTQFLLSVNSPAHSIRFHTRTRRVLFFSSFCVKIFMKWAIQVSITQIPRFQVDGFGCEEFTPRQGTIAVCATYLLVIPPSRESLRIIQRERRPTMHGWCFSLFTRRRILFIADIKFVRATAKTQVCHCNNGGQLSERHMWRISRSYVCLSVRWCMCISETKSACCLCVKSQMPFRESEMIE